VKAAIYVRHFLGLLTVHFHFNLSFIVSSVNVDFRSTGVFAAVGRRHVLDQQPVGIQRITAICKRANVRHVADYQVCLCVQVNEFETVANFYGKQACKGDICERVIQACMSSDLSLATMKSASVQNLHQYTLFRKTVRSLQSEPA
jgi:hypothetical protein